MYICIYTQHIYRLTRESASIVYTGHTCCWHGLRIARAAPHCMAINSRRRAMYIARYTMPNIDREIERYRYSSEKYIWYHENLLLAWAAHRSSNASLYCNR